MCYQLLELYSACRCVYYQHSVDRCPKYGEPGHGITHRTILVGYSCNDHSGDNTFDSVNIASLGFYSSSKQSKTPGKSQREAKPLKWPERKLRRAPDNTDYSPSYGSHVPTPERNISHQIGSTNSNTEEAGHSDGCHQRRMTSESEDFVEFVFQADDESDSEESVSNESVLWETESVISVASTATTVDKDATEAIFRRLLLFKDLKYLWPQLIRRCGSRNSSVITIERFLRRYSEDLMGYTTTMKEPDSGICLASSQFVRKLRLNLAHRIWEAHSESTEDHDETDDASADRTVDNISTEMIQDDNDQNFVYDLSERFLFETTPILALEASVKVFVGFPHTGVDGIASGLYRSTEIWFSNIKSAIHEPPLELGRQRLRWQCVSSSFYICQTPPEVLPPLTWIIIS